MGNENSEGTKSPAALIDNPMNYLSREMSMLKFFRRVLFEATNPETPLLERVRFLSILGSGLDEFFMVRVGGLSMGIDNDKERFYFEGMTPQKQLREIRKESGKIIAEAHECFYGMIKPQLDEAGIRIYHYDELNKAQKSRVDGYYKEVIFPVLTPLAFDPGHPFPYISNLSYNLAVVVEDQEGERHFARLKVPGSLPH
ncbi:MAG: hypothetical protein JW976_05480, partial [Syntrophaceae bacterium]|nr:hypothetical protein [Syntrophaceae bacterium]